MADKRMDVIDGTIDACWDVGVGDVNWELEESTDDCDAVDNVGSIDAAAVPCIGSRVCCLDKIGVGHTFFKVNGDGQVEGTKELFDRDSLVVTLSS